MMVRADDWHTTHKGPEGLAASALCGRWMFWRRERIRDSRSSVSSEGVSGLGGDAGDDCGEEREDG